MTLTSPFYGIRTNASDSLGSQSSLAESERWAKCDSDPTNKLFYFFMKLKISSLFNLNFFAEIGEIAALIHFRRKINDSFFQAEQKSFESRFNFRFVEKTSVLSVA